MQSLNDLCNQFTRLNCKFGGIQKNKKVLVIVLSNFSIDEAYHNLRDKDSEVLDSLKTRFRVIRFSKRQDDYRERQLSRSRSPVLGTVTNVEDTVVQTSSVIAPGQSFYEPGLFD